MPQVFRRCPGIIPGGMFAFKLDVGAIILERDIEASVNTKKIYAMCLPVFQVGTDQLYKCLFYSPYHRKGKKECVAMYKRSEAPQKYPMTPKICLNNILLQEAI